MNCHDWNCQEEICTSRNFFTKEEKVEMLQEYKEKLEKETKGVSELIAEIQKK